MSAEECKNCGVMRKSDQVYTPAGIVTYPCWNCEAPGWLEPYPEENSAKETAYMYACSEGGPHERLGLLWMGERKARGMVGE